MYIIPRKAINCFMKLKLYFHLGLILFLCKLIMGNGFFVNLIWRKTVLKKFILVNIYKNLSWIRHIYSLFYRFKSIIYYNTTPSHFFKYRHLCLMWFQRWNFPLKPFYMCIFTSICYAVNWKFCQKVKIYLKTPVILRATEVFKCDPLAKVVECNHSVTRIFLRSNRQKNILRMYFIFHRFVFGHWFQPFHSVVITIPSGQTTK